MFDRERMALQHRIDVYLQTAEKTCFLNLEPRYSLVVFLNLSSERPVTFIKNGTWPHAGLAQLLVSECLECTDTKTGQCIPVFDRKNVPQPTSSNADSPELMGLEPKRTTYLTFTNSTNPRAYEFDFVSSRLEPDRSYTIRCNAATLGWWSYKALEEVCDFLEKNLKLPSSETQPLRLESHNIVSFDTRAAMDKAPEIDVSLSAPSTLSISGNPPFEYIITFTSSATKPITVCSQHQGLESINTEIEILDLATRKRITPDLIDVYDEDRPLMREDFLRLNPEEPHVERRVLDPTERYSGLEDLKVDTKYALRMTESPWWWSYDSVDEVLKYAGDRGLGGLRPTRPIDLTSSNEVGFLTIQ